MGGRWGGLGTRLDRLDGMEWDGFELYDGYDEMALVNLEVL